MLFNPNKDKIHCQSKKVLLAYHEIRNGYRFANSCLIQFNGICYGFE